MRKQYAIGTTQETMQYLFQLGVPEPRSEYKPFAIAVQTGGLGVLGQGFPTDLWDWNMIREPARAVLKGFCPGLSAQVYVRTYNDSLATPAWEVYRARMLWTPEAEDRQNNARLKLMIRFRLLEQLAEL